ncbi:toprim domain-containing protein [Metamycoplasma equirhinis]|uniref:toprim domain-containing protein n=1 Tax=Metamycoplasma equirhinis TaxID=92402 RepID=UPI003593CB66
MAFNMDSPAKEKLENILKKIPGFTKKQIQRTINYFIETSNEQINELFERINTLKKETIKCEKCNVYSNSVICEICQDKLRDKKLLIVENQTDIKKFEELGVYKGKYFILEKLMDLKFENEIFKKNEQKLLTEAKKYDEIIFALSATIEGQLTTQYLQKKFRDILNVKNTYQLSIGIPLGLQVEYIDPITLKESLLNKTKL